MERITLSLAAASLGFLLLVLTSACNGDSRILELDSGPISEDALRVQIRQAAFNQPLSFEYMCSIPETFTAGEVLDLFAYVNLFATRTPVAQADANDELRAVEILREECESLT